MDINNMDGSTEVKEQVTLEDVITRLDILGEQMNWVVENLQGLFQFVQQVGQNGGGIRGIMQLLKSEKPQMIPMGDPNADR